VIKEKEAAAPPNADLPYPPGLTDADRSLSPQRQSQDQKPRQGQKHGAKAERLTVQDECGWGMRECSFSFALKYKYSVPFEIFQGGGVEEKRGNPTNGILLSTVCQLVELGAILYIVSS
jgi:hypothetical protein